MSLTIPRRLALLVCAAVIVSLAAIAVQLLSSRAHMVEQRKTAVQGQVETAVSIVKALAAEADKGSLSAAEAETRAKAALRAIRFGKDDYIFVYRDDGTNVVLGPRPDLEGKLLIDLKDPNGVPFVRNLIDAAKGGGGFVDYMFTRPGSSVQVPKLGYALYFAPWKWMIGTGVYVDDLDALAYAELEKAIVWALGLIAVLVAVALPLSRGLVKPLTAMKASLWRLAEGDFDVALPGLERKDEVGEIARAVEGVKTKAMEKAQREAQERRAEEARIAEEKRLNEEREAARRQADEERRELAGKEAMHTLMKDFEKALGSVIDTVASAATELEASATTLTGAADATRHRANAVAAASEEASANVQSVASATDQLTASVGEISKQVEASSQIARQAVSQAEKTDARVNELSQAASRIGDVVQLITAIAEQTNLLALNATIEAARAGEAGKGFAVVASEVKALAAQTAKATGDIGSQITQMQTATQDSVKAIKEIGTTIDRISEIAAAIATAVEEQGAATREIARSVDQAARGTGEVSSNIAEVSQHASETGAASSQMLSSAKSLSHEGNRLKQEMDQFLSTIRTGIAERRKGDDPTYDGPERRQDRGRLAGTKDMRRAG